MNFAETTTCSCNQGILAFNIIQAKDLLVRDQAGELDGATRPKGGGRPAIAAAVDGVEGEELDPVSSYAEVRFGFPSLSILFALHLSQLKLCLSIFL